MFITRQKSCYFCQQGIREIDYKNSELLGKFMGGSAKIETRKRTGCCSKHQRKLATAVKRARFLALLPYIQR
jgi:small subunit ribosomal protein S18